MDWEIHSTRSKAFAWRYSFTVVAVPSGVSIRDRKTVQLQQSLDDLVPTETQMVKGVEPVREMMTVLGMPQRPYLDEQVAVGLDHPADLFHVARSVEDVLHDGPRHAEIERGVAGIEDARLDPTKRNVDLGEVDPAGLGLCFQGRYVGLVHVEPHDGRPEKVRQASGHDSVSGSEIGDRCSV